MSWEQDYREVLIKMVTAAMRQDVCPSAIVFPERDYLRFAQAFEAARHPSAPLRVVVPPPLAVMLRDEKDPTHSRMTQIQVADSFAVWLFGRHITICCGDE